MKRLATTGLMLALCGLCGLARAEDKTDPTGTWKWSTQNAKKKAEARETVLKLKLEGDKLTGHIIGRNDREIKIEEASFKDGEISFSVTQGRNDQKVTSKYKGKLEGDKIVGKVESERNGTPRKRDWEAKRSTEKEKT